MKALTIRQPWASLIAVGAKTIETRSWSTKYRGPLAIHAGMRFHPFDDAYARLVSADVAPMDALEACSSRRIDLVPRGAVVATCTLANVVPIVNDGTARNCVDVRPMSWPDNAALRVDDADGQEVIVDVGDQVGLGDFTPGRFAWLLEDIKSTTEQCPTCEGNAGARERAWHDAGGSGICDAAHGSCFTPWCRCRCHTEARCPTCRGEGRCDPIPAKGRQGLWDWDSGELDRG